MKREEMCLAIVLGTCALVSDGCAKKTLDHPPSSGIDVGRFEGTTYRNDFLGMTITFPSDWSIQSNKTTRKMMRVGSGRIAGDDSYLQEVVKGAEARVVGLFGAFRYPPGASNSENPGVACTAGPISGVADIRTGKDYLLHAKRLLESSPMKFSFLGEIYTRKIGGIEFSVMKTAVALPPDVVNMEYYATIRRGYTLVLTVSWESEEGKSMVQGILDTMVFTPAE